MSATAFANDVYITVYPFSRQIGGEETVIGRSETNTFLALPHEAVEILDDLASGKSVGEARALYMQRHGEDPDLEDFLQLLAQRGFVRPRRPGESADIATVVATPLPMAKTHFDNLPDWIPRFFFGPVALALYFSTILAGAVVVFFDPSLFPGRSALYFERYHTVKILGVVLFSFVTLFFHEMSHLLAARAAGVKAKLGISHRLWVLVAETDMTGLWAVAKNRRYLPLVAGPITDLFSGSLILLVLAAARHELINLSPLTVEMLRAIFFAYFLQFAWQFFFFVRTDFYYVLTTAFDCKNLLGDAEQLLRNRMVPLLRRLPAWSFLPAWQHEDLGHIAPRERRLIGVYSWIWIFGRLVAMTLLFTVTLPVTWVLVVKSYHALVAGYAADSGAFLDAVLMAAVFVGMWGVGMGMWLNSLRQSWKKS